MREVAYLTNVYPAASHTFIRREIAELEAVGWRVHRFSHRRSPSPLVDPADLAEQSRTTVLLEPGVHALLGAIGRCALERPRKTLITLRLAFRLARGSDRPLLAHLGYFALACLMARHLERLGRPHLHVHFGTNPADVALLCHRLSGASYSVTFHGPHEFVTPDRLHLDAKIAGAEFIVAVSETGRNALLARFPQVAGRLLLVRCGLDREWRERARTPVPASNRLVSVARLDEQKNPRLLVDAAARLAARGVSFALTLAGDGPLRGALERQIAGHRLEGHVVLAGWQTQRQIAAALAGARALVLSSRAEGLPVAIMESFAMGRPAIATDVGGVRELVESDSTGWLVPPEDPEALADAMQRALEAPLEELQRLADAARRRVETYDVRAASPALAAAFERARSGRESA